MLDKLYSISNWVLPRLCVACGFCSANPYLDLCKFCKKSLPWFSDGCYRCGAQLANANAAITCTKCADNPPPFERLCALFKYEPPLSLLINRLKFQQQLFPGKFFGQLLGEAVAQRWYIDKLLPQAIIPVPLHSKRQRQRGYNQALEISIAAARVLRIPLCTDICERIKNTKAQARLDRTYRLSNVQNAFRARTKISLEHVAVVDDVVTTASTARAVCQALLTAGVEHIDVWCICR